MAEKAPRCAEKVDFLVTDGGRRNLRYCRLNKRHKGKHRFRADVQKMKSDEIVTGEFFWP